MLFSPLIPDFIFYFLSCIPWDSKILLDPLRPSGAFKFPTPLYLLIPSEFDTPFLFQIFPVFDSLNLEWTLHLAMSMRELKIILLSLCCFDRYLMEEWMSADLEVVGRDLPNANVPRQMTLDLTVRGAPLLKPVMRKQALMSP